MAESQLAALKKQRSTNKAKLTNLAKYAQEDHIKTDINELTTRLQRVEKLMQEFTDLEFRIFSIDPEEESDLKYEENYYIATAAFNNWIRSKTIDHGAMHLDLSHNTTQQGEHPQVKLPKIHIPLFSGEYSEWQSFLDLFTTTIHEAPNLNAVQKFQYLKGLLRGEAAVLLRHIAVTEANYIGALNKLKERYGRKKQIINTFIRTFVEQPPIHNATASSIKRLMDTSDEVVRGLKALGEVAETRDPWLIYLLMQKLDDKSKAMWTEYSASMINPELSEFLKFLGRRVDTLEALVVPTKKSYTKPEIRSHVVTSESNVQIEGHVATGPSQSKSRTSTSDARKGSRYKFKCAMCNQLGHSLPQCSLFRKLDAHERSEFIKTSGRCSNCLSIKHTTFLCQSERNCLKCDKRHHTLLHDNQVGTSSQSNISANTQTIQSSENKQTHNSVSNANATLFANATNQITPAVLPTALIHVQDGNGHLQLCRALLDSGSQASFISEKCVQRLQLKRFNSRIIVTGLGQSQAGISKGSVKIVVKPKYGETLIIDALILSKVASSRVSLPEVSNIINSLANIQLADPLYDKAGEIDVLIGADHFFNILLQNKISIKGSNLVAQESIFGWVIAGTTRSFEPISITSMTVMTEDESSINIDKTLRQFWELEGVQSNKILSDEEIFCEKHFNQHTSRNHEGRLIVSLPFKRDPRCLGNSYNRAFQRIQWMERKFTKDQEFKKMYHEFIDEYIKLNHMRETNDPADDGYFLPHHGVLKQLSNGNKKIRVVFDGSALTSKGESINKCLAVGPTVQPTLSSILLRFRERKVVFSSDMEKMYRQIQVAEHDTKYQKILWREDPSKPIKRYELLRVTYGLSSSAFLATRSIKFIGDSIRDRSPHLAELIDDDIYVDDIMTGANTEEEAMKLKADLIHLLNQFGITLKKWKSNNIRVLDDVPIEDRDTENKQFINGIEPSDTTKILGISWNPSSDRFKFSATLSDQIQFTKRSVLSDISKLFDPLGWASPIIIACKSFMQLIWAANLDWDDELPAKLIEKWKSMRMELRLIDKIQIPRYINTINSSIVDIHGFADASTIAYAAVVYFRITDGDGNVQVQLISAKTKVSPIKQISLPRLELCAALLLVQLINYVETETRCKIHQITGWSDSTIVLDWIAGHPKRWSTFVGNRTTEIKNKLSRRNWKHVPTSDNPADCASRGLTTTQLLNHELWWKGPNWLWLSQNHWPQQRLNYETAEEESNELFSFTGSTKNDWLAELMNKFNSFHKLILVFGYIMRFSNNIAAPKAVRTIGKFLSVQEICLATRRICRYEQEQFYHSELNTLETTKQVHHTSHLLSLNPFLDKNGIMRVGGRIDHSDAPYNVRHPIIMHQNSRGAALILMDEHNFNNHAGPTLMTTLSRQKFWIPKCKGAARLIIKDCTTCTRYKAVLQQQIMGDLPAARVRYSRPFESVGVDFAGPMQIHLAKGRGSRPRKSYLCIFICLSVKAMHIELVSDLSTDSFLGALKCFIARRGICRHIYSDNGTNFTGAAAKIRGVFETLVKESGNISSYLSRNQITWHFNPPNAPHFGGIWESAVRSVKFHLRRVIGKTILTLEEMTTLLADIESTLNSRPLCRSNAEEIDALTPSHFLIGYQAGTLPEMDLVNYKPSYLSRWQQVQKLSQHFWRRWYLEYLTSLQQRSKWLRPQKSVEIGDVVLIKEPNLKPRDWLMGQIKAVFPGSDGQIRVVSIQSSKGELRRPIHNICLLPVDVKTSEVAHDVDRR